MPRTTPPASATPPADVAAAAPLDAVGTTPLDAIGTGALSGLRWQEFVPEPGAADLLDTPDAWVFHALARCAREIELHDLGTDDYSESARSWAAQMAHDEDEAVRRVVVFEDDGENDGDVPGTPASAGDGGAGHGGAGHGGAEDGGAGHGGAGAARVAGAAPADRPAVVAGWASVWLPLSANRSNAGPYVAVHPRWRGRGLGAALYAWAEGRAVAEGRTVLQTGVMSPEEVPGAERVAPATGVGTVPTTPGLRFAVGRGHTLEQVARVSTLDLPVDAALLDRLAADAAERSAGYRLHTWRTTVPDEFLDAYAAMQTMMIDAPNGGLEIEEEPYDAARIRREEAEAAEAGDDCLITVAEHVATGELAGFTVIEWETRAGESLAGQADDGDGPREAADQGDTLVARDHRGHRLGMAMKVANLRAFTALRPGVRRLHTWNAEENDHMLAINVALGFRPDGGSAALQKRLPPA